jgi:multicomponent Na+:H+ antiporter subunit E
VTFLLLFIFWLILSQRFEPLYIISGIVCSAIVAFLSHPLLFKAGIGHGAAKRSILFIVYCFYLLYQILVASLDVVYRVWHPDMPIDPGFIEYESSLITDGGKTALANSITLTPGTITLDIVGEKYTIHELLPKAASSIENMERFIKRFMK